MSVPQSKRSEGQLAVLDDLDHEIKEWMGIKGYVRYMDDFILVHESKEHLEKCLETIAERLADLGLELNMKKTKIQPISHGINFLGFTYKLTETGAVVMKLQKGKASKERRKLCKQSVSIDPDKLDESYKSWRTFVSKGSTYGLLYGMDCYYERLLK